MSLDERVEYRAEDHTQGSGVLKLLAPGLTLTLRDLARLMIVISDNVSTNLVMRALGGPQAAHAAVHALPVALPATTVGSYIDFKTAGPDGVAVVLAERLYGPAQRHLPRPLHGLALRTTPRCTGPCAGSSTGR